MQLDSLYITPSLPGKPTFVTQPVCFLKFQPEYEINSDDITMTSLFYLTSRGQSNTRSRSRVYDLIGAIFAWT